MSRTAGFVAVALGMMSATALEVITPAEDQVVVADRWAEGLPKYMNWNVFLGSCVCAFFLERVLPQSSCAGAKGG